MKVKKILSSIVVTLFIACSTSVDHQNDVQGFIDSYTAEFLVLQYTAAEAEWISNTIIVDGDDSNSRATRKANEEMAAFTGSVENINKTKEFLSKKDMLTVLQIKQLEVILQQAANNPQTVPDLVKERIKSEAEAVEILFGFDFKIDGKSVSTNEIDAILRTENDLSKRMKAWEASKEVGKVLKDNLVELRRLRNETVRALDYDDYFSYQVSDYGMTTDEMVSLMREINRQVRPLYKEIHTYVRYELAEKYGVKDVPDMIPAHWLQNRWSQDWNEMITVEGIDINGVLAKKSAEWIMKQGEEFYKSLGFDALPKVFWDKSSLYPLPAGADYKKNNHASAWHMDLESDVRSLMSVEPNASWYETVHHELGHIYYYMSYTNPDIPPLLRGGANRGYHEGIGSLMGLAAMQKPFLENLNLIKPGTQSDENMSLLKEAMNYVVFLPWSAGVMTEFEYELYANELPAEEFNEKWWELKQTYQGVSAPKPRGSEFNDPASKTHIINDAAQYYDYAISYILLFQLHGHIAENILNQDTHATNYFGNKKVGDFLYQLMRPGSSRDWREVLKETTGEDLDANAMLKYFEPLMEYLKKENAGRKHTISDL